MMMYFKCGIYHEDNTREYLGVRLLDSYNPLSLRQFPRTAISIIGLREDQPEYNDVYDFPTLEIACEED